MKNRVKTFLFVTFGSSAVFGVAAAVAEAMHARHPH